MGMRGILWSGMVLTLLEQFSRVLPHLHQGGNTNHDCDSCWDKKWFGQWLRMQLDTSAMVAVGSSGVSHYSESMHLLRYVLLPSSSYRLHWCTYRERKHYIDVLSRNNLPLYYSFCPQACHCHHISSCSSRAVGGTAPGLDHQSLNQFAEQYFPM